MGFYLSFANRIVKKYFAHQTKSEPGLLDYEPTKLPSVSSQCKPRSKSSSVLFILLIYLALTIIYTYPLILEFQKALPTDRTGIHDEFIFVWNIFWAKHALINFQNPFFTNYIYYPHGTNLAFHSFSFAYSLIAAILSVVSRDAISLFGSYNVIIFWSFVSAAFFMYLLVRQLKGSRKAAFCAGVIFSFSTIHVSMIPHLHYLGIEFLPLTLLFYFKWHERLERINLILLALSLGILLYNSQIYFLIVTVILTLDSIFRILRKRISPKELIAGYCIMAIIFFLVSAPMVVALVHDSLQSAPSAEISFPFCHSADITNYLLPTDEHIIFPSMNLFANDAAFIKFFGDLFLTWSLCFGLIISIALIRKKENLFWILLAAISLALSFGRSLDFFRKPIIDFPMPFAWVEALFPFLKTFRYPMGFSVFLLLAISVLVAKGADVFWEKTKNLSWLRVGVLPFVLVFLVFVEGLKTPMPMSRPSMPSVYQYLASDDAECGVIEWPLLSIPLSRESLYYQTFHKKKLVELATHSGIFPRSKSETTELILKSPFYRFAETPEDFDLLEKDSQDRCAEEDNAFFKRNYIKYLLIHMKYVDYQKRAPLLSFIRHHNPYKEIYDDNIYLFQLYK